MVVIVVIVGVTISTTTISSLIRLGVNHRPTGRIRLVVIAERLNVDVVDAGRLGRGGGRSGSRVC